MESESSRDESTEIEGSKSAKGKKHSHLKDVKDETSDIKPPAGTPHSASTKLAKRALFPTTPASYSDDDSSQGAGRKRRRKYTTSEKPQNTGIHLSERQQVLLLKTFAAENSPKANSPALSAASSSQGTYSASSGTDRLHKRNIRGETLLHIAAYRGEVKQMIELIEQGLDVNALDNADWTPLHEACNKGFVEPARVLLEHGAFVNAKGNEDITPLHDAAGSGSAELVKLLLEHGADPNMRDKNGKYPIDMPSSPTIVNVIKNWPTYRPVDESSNMSAKLENEFSATESPRINSAANVVSPAAQSLSSYESAPQTLNTDQEMDQGKPTITISPSVCSSTSTLKQLNESDCQQREPPPPLSAGDDECARGRLSVDINEENPPPPLLTPQLPDDSATEKSPGGDLLSAPLRGTSSPLLPPCLESAVANVPSLETLASSPPLVVITDVDIGNKPAKSGDLLLKVCTSSEREKKPPLPPQKAEPSEEPSTKMEETKIPLVISEATVASSRTRRKINSKEAPASSTGEDKKTSGGYRKRLGSVGVVSPGNKDKDSGSSNSVEPTAKVQPLRKRLITRTDEDGDKQAPKEKRKNASAKEKPPPSNESSEQGQHPPADPYEFVEEVDSVTEVGPQQLGGTTPTLSPRNSASHASPAIKQAAQNAAAAVSAATAAAVGTTQSSPSVSSTKTNGSGSRRHGHRSRRASSPSSLTPNEMKLPPLKIRLNRGGNPVAEAGRQSESESSVSSTCGPKNETDDTEEHGRTDQDASTVRVKDEPGTEDEDKRNQAESSKNDAGNNSNVPPRKRKVRGSGAVSPVGPLSVVTNTPGNTSPVVSPSSIPTAELTQFLTAEKPRIPIYIRQWHNARKWAAERRQQMVPIQLPSIPRGVGDFLMIRKGYLLAADGGQQIISGINPNQESQPPQPPTTLALNVGSNSGAGGNTFSSALPPCQQPSPTLPPSLQALFRSQEETRHRLRMQHRVEQEKLVLSYEQEVLRAYVHRELTAVQAQPLSACAFLSDANMAARAPVEALITGQVASSAANNSQAGNSNSGNNNPDIAAQQRALRLTARQQRPRLDDLDEKFTRLTDALLQRQRHEAAATRAVQAAEWAWRSEIVSQMSSNDFPLSSPGGSGGAQIDASNSQYQANANTVPLVEVPLSLPIPRLF